MSQNINGSSGAFLMKKVGLEKKIKEASKLARKASQKARTEFKMGKPLLPVRKGLSKKAFKIGKVINHGNKNTLKVQISDFTKTKTSLKYGILTRHRKHFQVHDKFNVAKPGDLVQIRQCEKLSLTKHFELYRIIHRSSKSRVHKDIRELQRLQDMALNFKQKHKIEVNYQEPVFNVKNHARDPKMNF